MRVACHTFSAISAVFQGAYAESHFLPTNVDAMRASVLALHENAFDKTTWQSYSKFGVLPFPQLDPNLGTGPDAMRKNLDAAVEHGLAYVRPRDHPMAFGNMANAGDKRPGAFVTEKDFLVWLLYKNLTVCDLDGTQDYLYKGRLLPRATRPCPADAP